MTEQRIRASRKAWYLIWTGREFRCARKTGARLDLGGVCAALEGDDAGFMCRDQPEEGVPGACADWNPTEDLLNESSEFVDASNPCVPESPKSVGGCQPRTPSPA
jgi:hypothetical protein